MNIVVVDDDPAIRMAMTTTLTRQGHDVQTFADGEKAMVYLSANPDPDAIITDLMMTRLDGWGLLQFLRQRNLLARVIVISGVSSPRLAGYDVHCFLRKPVRLPELLAMLNEIAGE